MSHPVTFYLEEEANPQLTTASFKGIYTAIGKISPEPPFFQARQPGRKLDLCSDPSPHTGFVLQTLYLLCFPSLDMLTVLPVVSEGPKTEHGIQGVAFTMSSTAVSPFPGPVIHASSQNAIGLGHLGTCWLTKKRWFPLILLVIPVSMLTYLSVVYNKF